MDADDKILETARAYLRERVAPEAQRIDRDPEALREALTGLAERGLLALKRPLKFGGPALGEPAFRKFQEEVARASGALAFLQTQHQSAVSMLAGSENEALKAEYLPEMDAGRLVGIGFSQLRRPGPPIMRANPEADGYRLSGSVPWVTGWSYYQEFLIGATLPDGRALFAPVPLENRPGPERVEVSPPMRLAAMDSALTVSVEIDGFFVPEERVAFVRPAGWIQNNDMINIALQGSFAMGCAQAGIDVVRRNAEKRDACFLHEAADRLQEELERCRARAEELRTQITDETEPQRLALRAWQIELAVRCAHAAVTSSSGAANSIDHPAQRIYREALVYTVSAQTSRIMEATVARLARK